MSENAKRDWSESKRTHRRRVNLRVTDEELVQLEQCAERLSTSVSSYVKSAALNQPVPRRTSRPVDVDRAAILKLLAELGKIGSNANQIAKANNVLARVVLSQPLDDPGSVQDAIRNGRRSLEQIDTELQEMRRAIYDALSLK